jgi:hypothetical protein
MPRLLDSTTFSNTLLLILDPSARTLRCGRHEAAAQERGRQEYHHRCEAAQTPGNTPSHQPRPSAGNRGSTKSPGIQYHIPADSPDDVASPGQLACTKISTTAILPEPSSSCASTSAPTPHAFEFGKNKHRAENFLDAFKIYFDNDAFDLKALQKLCFIAGMNLAPDTASDCRMVCQSLQ